MTTADRASGAQNDPSTISALFLIIDDTMAQQPVPSSFTMTTYKHSHDVIATDLGDELVLLDPRNGEMFGLNACGRRVWIDLETASTSTIAESMCSEFTVSPDDALADVESVVRALADAGLITHDDGPAQPR